MTKLIADDEGLVSAPSGLALTRVVESPAGVAHLRYGMGAG
jgi:hypothetical protein